MTFQVLSIHTFSDSSSVPSTPSLWLPAWSNKTKSWSSILHSNMVRSLLRLSNRSEYATFYDGVCNTLCNGPLRHIFVLLMCDASCNTCSTTRHTSGVSKLAFRLTQGGIKPATLRLPEDSSYLLSQCHPITALMYWVNHSTALPKSLLLSQITPSRAWFVGKWHWFWLLCGISAGGDGDWAWLCLPV